ncbi:hypothetical protein SDC9_151909 [bioreactor metagenome]|uniref:Uncharacterized protein n=1 Tax=bioreactor metagenome TaxID=1076179 RepID=A0A645EW12_9ZZZZ
MGRAGKALGQQDLLFLPLRAFFHPLVKHGALQPQLAQNCKKQRTVKAALLRQLAQRPHQMVGVLGHDGNFQPRLPPKFAGILALALLHQPQQRRFAGTVGAAKRKLLAALQQKIGRLKQGSTLTAGRKALPV